MELPSWTWWLACALGAGVSLLVSWILWWWLPKYQVSRYRFADAKTRADIEDNFRKTVGQALGGIAVLIGAVVAYLQFTQQQRAAHDLLISNQVAKGFEQLGNDKQLVVRLGGIYGLEGVMNTSEQYHQPVLEALCAFVREGTMGKTVGDHPATDIQAALTVIGRRREGAGRVNLVGAKISGADLSGAKLNGYGDVELNDVDLSGADLTGANLDSASLNGANLSGAVLIATNMHDASLIHANLSRVRWLLSAQQRRMLGEDSHRFADMPSGPNLSGANLSYADLSGANLSYADLSHVTMPAGNLQDADLFHARLSGANLSHTNLSRAQLSDTELVTQAQLNEACGDDAQLPSGLTLRPCPDH